MISLHNITKTFGNVTALDGIDLAIDSGRTTVIMGPSGSGKSTLLRCLNLLEWPDAGKLVIDDAELTFPTNATRAQISAIRAKSAMVFQQFNLFPHLTVLKNVTLSPALHGESSASAERRARELLARVGVEEMADRYPMQLSDGQRTGNSNALLLLPVRWPSPRTTCCATSRPRPSIRNLPRKYRRYYVSWRPRTSPWWW